MGLNWIVSIVMLIQQAFHPDSLVIAEQGQPIVNIKRSDYILPYVGLPFTNETKLNKLIDEVYGRLYHAPINAGLNEYEGIIPEQMGSELDRRAFMDQVYKFIVEGTASNIEAPQQIIHPKVDSELLTSIREKKIGQYTTYFNSRNKNRSKNINLAAQAINNQYVFPGESFSFNGIVGERTTSKGYLRAKVIVKGEVAEGIGGGICQISSTLFNAVDRAGLQIIKRYSHSRSVPYVPPGRDATVSWYGPDFVFQNKYDQPILIRSVVYGGQVTIIIYTSDEVHVKQRGVPSASKRLPEEVPADQNVNRIH
ncbi:VanW family protein [Cohnella sp. WQ 127256]|uniref:VanW family protein n=1 Tax=Cohnella sp. WQ 127256 TaxID=2938790 RepID=UPI0021183268|nr:VanW family protein [Cohnella sp. WQ 127256]